MRSGTIKTVLDAPKLGFRVSQYLVGWYTTQHNSSGSNNSQISVIQTHFNKANCNTNFVAGTNREWERWRYSSACVNERVRKRVCVCEREREREKERERVDVQKIHVHSPTSVVWEVGEPMSLGMGTHHHHFVCPLSHYLFLSFFFLSYCLSLSLFLSLSLSHTHFQSHYSFSPSLSLCQSLSLAKCGAKYLQA